MIDANTSDAGSLAGAVLRKPSIEERRDCLGFLLTAVTLLNGFQSPLPHLRAFHFFEFLQILKSSIIYFPALLRYS